MNKKTIKKKLKGGFYPSIMGGVITHGKIILPLVLRQGVRLFTSKNKTKKSLRKKNKKNTT